MYRDILAARGLGLWRHTGWESRLARRSECPGAGVGGGGSGAKAGVEPKKRARGEGGRGGAQQQARAWRAPSVICCLFTAARCRV
jgi:hypothetical protein